MDKNGILLIRDRWAEYEEILTDVDYGGFSYDYELNATRQLTFRVFKTPYNEFAYSLLINEAVVIYQGQEFVIKKCLPNITGQSETKDITAIHVSLCVTDDHYQYESKAEPGTYSLDDIMKFALKGNKLGITYEIIGSFGNKKIDNISPARAKNIIKDIGCDVFGAIFFADNKHIKMYHPDSWYRESQKTFRYLYNTDDVNVTYDTTNLKTYIKAYGKEKEYKDSRTNITIPTSRVTYHMNWLPGGITRTKDTIAKFVFTGTGVDVHFKKSKVGGKVHIDVDGSNGKNGTTYSEKGGTLTLTIRGLEHKEHTCNIKFTGTDTKNPNTKKRKISTPVVETSKSGKITRKTKITYEQTPAELELKNPIATIYEEATGDDLFEAVVTYESPESYAWGYKMAEPVTDNTITDKAKLLEFAKSQLQDYPDMSLTITYRDTNELVDVRDVWMLIHEPLGISSDVKLVSLKSPHPFTHLPQELVFSSARKDMAKIQKQFNKAVYNMTKSLRAVNSTVSSTLPNTQEAYNAISAVTNNVEFDSERGLKTTRKVLVNTPTPAQFSTMAEEDTEIEEVAGSVIMGNGAITAVTRDGTETEVITPDGLNLAATYGSLPDEIIDDITDRIGLSADAMYLTSPDGKRWNFSVDNTGKLTMVRV